MDKIKDYLKNLKDNVIDEPVFYTALGVMMVSGVALVTAVGALTVNSIRVLNTNLNPPVYTDVNEDGINDKIVQMKVREQTSGLFPLTYYRLEDEVFYGVEVNGRDIYLSKDQFGSSQ